VLQNTCYKRRSGQGSGPQTAQGMTIRMRKGDELEQKRALKKTLLKHKKALQAEMDVVAKALKALAARRSVGRSGTRKTKAK